ncbi:hypothetical protein RRF57_009871 [Xylaria bambusicola]|uniref:Uncharacterized protein n=1 Tax=Xylaria bambusicola TaxID=326684 RepID=A0AAN7Z861_9PEZI
MEVRFHVIRPKDARQYRKRSVSVLPSSDPTQCSVASRYVEYSKASTASRSPAVLESSSKTHELVAAAKRAQDGLRDYLIAEALVIRERQYEELGRIRQLRDAVARETRAREEASRRQQTEKFEQIILEFETRRAIEQEERFAEDVRREAIRESIRESIARVRDEAARQRQLEQDRILAEHIEEAARIEEAQIRAQEEAEERERIRQERLRECAVCMEGDDMSSMIQTPCTHWYCHEDLRSKSICTLVPRRITACANGPLKIKPLSRTP